MGIIKEIFSRAIVLPDGSHADIVRVKPKSGEKSKANDPDERRRLTGPSEELKTAIHEAGHAVFGFTLCNDIDKVWIEPPHESPIAHYAGQCEHKGTIVELSRFAYAGVYLAGMVATSIHLGGPCLGGCDGDAENVLKALDDGNTDALLRLYRLEVIWSEVERTLTQPNCVAAVKSLADRLLAKRTVESSEAREIMRAAGLEMYWLSKDDACLLRRRTALGPFAGSADLEECRKAAIDFIVSLVK